MGNFMFEKKLRSKKEEKILRVFFFGYVVSQSTDFYVLDMDLRRDCLLTSPHNLHRAPVVTHFFRAVELSGNTEL